MLVPFPLAADATFALLLLWLALAAWVVGARLHHDRHQARREHDARLLEDGADPARWRSGALERVADGLPGRGASVAAWELVQRDSRRLRRRARERSFRRTQALRVLTRGGWPLAFGLLRAAVANGSPDVRAAVVAIAAEHESPDADALLLDVLVGGAHPRSRTATELTPRAARLVRELVELATHEEPDVRYWALMLLREAAADPRTRAAAVAASTDRVATVRGAAARLLGAGGDPDAQHVVRALLGDDVFYVRAHAARAAGDVGAEHLADDVAALLADTSWWVRAAAKESLLVLGESGLAAATAMVRDADRFARDGAMEVVSAFRRLPRAAPAELAG
jgi:HEAT repeat protein